MKKVLFFIGLLYGGIVYASLEDTAENRLIQADRYLDANSPQSIFSDIAADAMPTISSNERRPFTEMLTKHLDINVLSVTMKTALVKHFTAEELKVLADFYSQPAAKSALKKMNNYMSDVLPVVQIEMMKAQQKAFQDAGTATLNAQ